MIYTYQWCSNSAGFGYTAPPGTFSGPGGTELPFHFEFDPKEGKFSIGPHSKGGAN